MSSESAAEPVVRDLSRIDAFFIVREKKDQYCVDPLLPAFAGACRSLTVIDPGAVRSVTGRVAHPSLNALAGAVDPLVVCSSLSGLRYARFIRGGDKFISVGVEHGVAPFKRYSYTRGLLAYDGYMAPTVLWAERLKRLFEKHADRVFVGGYPRLAYLTALRNRQTTAAGDDKPPCLVVVLSWGTSVEALESLPSAPGLTYLLHPAVTGGHTSLMKRRSDVTASTPERAADLLARATLVLGDFSSMTLEACHMGVATCMFLCRELYRSDCDLPAEFFERGHADYGAVAHTGGSIPQDCILDYGTFRAVLQNFAEGGDTHAFLAAAGVRRLDEGLPEDALPPAGDAVAAILDGTRQVVARTAVRPAVVPGEGRYRTVRQMALTYLEVAGRPMELRTLAGQIKAHPANVQPDREWAAALIASEEDAAKNG